MRRFAVPIYPSDYQKYLHARFQQCPAPLHPALFLQQWQLSYAELARLVGCSVSTVDHWFSTGSSHREPALAHCRQLAIIHRLWLNADRITPELIHLWCNSGN